MLIRVGLAVAAFLTSGAMAAAKHPHHGGQVMVPRQVPVSTYQSFNYAGSGAPKIQNQAASALPIDPEFIAPQGVR